MTTPNRDEGYDAMLPSSLTSRPSKCIGSRYRIQRQPAIRRARTSLLRNGLTAFLVMLSLAFSGGNISFATAQPNQLPATDDRILTPPANAPSMENTREALSNWKAPLQQAIRTGPFEKTEAGRLALLYEQNGWRPFFIGTDFSINPNGHYFLSRTQSLVAEGFDPGQFPLTELSDGLTRLQALRTRNPTLLSTTPATTMYAMHSPGTPSISDQNRSARIDGELDQLYSATSRLDSLLLSSLLRWIQDMNPFETFEGQKTLQQHPTFAGYLDSLKPNTVEYSLLQQALGHYLTLSTTVSIAPPLGGKKSLRPGAKGKQIETLQSRLATEGYYSGEINGRFNDATEQAVKAYQQQHLLAPDGVVGRRTKAWLNTSYDSKAKLIAESLRAIRRSQARRYDHYLRINIPEFMLGYYRDGKLVEQHKIVVGRSTGRKFRSGERWVGENHTPSLTSSIRRIIINPRWYVPERIRLELDKKIEENPDYLAEHGFVPMNSEYSFGEPRIYQQPGRANPLGKVKFEFPNRYSVYLHDTSQKSLFQRARRDFSHGCIRVDQAVALAQQLLRDDHNPAVDKIEAYLGGTTQKSIQLITPVPIIVEYIAVSVTNEGQLIFCGDPYGRVIKNRGRGFPL